MVKTALIAFPFVVWGVTLLTFVRRLPVGWRMRWGWGLCLFLCASKFLLFAGLGGNAFNPEMPAPLIWISNVLYSGMVLLSALAFVAWCCRLRGRVLWLLPLVAFVLSVRGVYNGLRVPVIRELELTFANLPAELDGYRIVHVTDIHVSASARRWRTEAIVRRINDRHPDLIVCTGDIVDGDVETERDDVAPLCDLVASDGVYFCTGNHEYYRDSENWLRQYRDWNLRLLENACVFPRPCLAVGGIPDQQGCKTGAAKAPDVRGAFASATNAEFRVLLSHRPNDPVAGVPQSSYDLQLSGHTHGGIMPILDRLVQAFNNGYVRGLYKSGERPLVYVSPGAGQWAGFPLRFMNDAEITLITLKALTPPI